MSLTESIVSIVSYRAIKILIENKCLYDIGMGYYAFSMLGIEVYVREN